MPVNARAAAQNQLIVYYANETTKQAATFANDASLLSVLRRSSNPVAARVADNIVADANKFPASVQLDVNGLLKSAKRHRFDLAVFTNALALEDRYLFYRSSADVLETRQLPSLPNAPTAALATSPLARPEYFRAALSEAGALYPPDSFDLVLITISHGGGDLALTPRVFAELTEASTKQLETELNSPSSEAAQPASWARYRGTTKLEYWRVLAEASAFRGIRFSLVFRAACDSGVSSWAELFAIPASVEVIADTRDDAIYFNNQIDYAKVFDFEGRGTDLTPHIADALKSGHIHIDSRATLCVWLIRDELMRYHPTVLFIPLALWIVWIAWAPALAATRRFAASRPLRH